MSDDYEARLAAWKSAQGVPSDMMAAPDAEQRMAAEDAKSKGKAYCWKCADEFPICEMRVDTDPYIQDEEAEIGDDGYIPKKHRIRVCKACQARDEADEE